MSFACLMFVPAAGLGAMGPSYPVFLSALFVLAGGITLLQVAANPYVAVLGPAKTSSSRLNLVQAFNSMGTFVAPTFGGLLILARSTSGTAKAGATVTLAERLQDAKAVQGPYIGIAVVLFLLAVAIFIARLPKVATHPETGSERSASVWRHPLLLLGVVAIFAYVGAEVTVGSFMISYISSPHVVGVTTAAAAKFVTFYWGGAMVGRFIGSAVMRKINPALILGVNCLAAVVALVVSMLSGGEVALWSIILVGLCNSIMFPTIFTLAIKGLGPLTGRGSGFLIMAICGGGILPLIQGYLADLPGVGLTWSFIAPAICYLYVVYFAWKNYQLRAADDTDEVPAIVGH
jgi:FHS family L-fucose permease-like MFS transporter